MFPTSSSSSGQFILIYKLKTASAVSAVTSPYIETDSSQTPIFTLRTRRPLPNPYSSTEPSRSYASRKRDTRTDSPGGKSASQLHQLGDFYTQPTHSPSRPWEEGFLNSALHCICRFPPVHLSNHLSVSACANRGRPGGKSNSPFANFPFSGSTFFTAASSSRSWI
jgi:hypothetical protein